MNAFMKEEVDFPDMPADHRGYSTSCNGSHNGKKMSKTVTATVKMPDGSEVVLTKTEEREFKK